MPYDLHAHTTASDGTYTPRELVLHAKQQSLTGVGITDHDTVNGIRGALEAAEQSGVIVVPGVELGTVHDEKEIHMLGYYIDTHSSYLDKLFSRMQTERYERMEKMVHRLQAANVPIQMEDVLEETKGAVIGRPHLARVLVTKGVTTSLQDAFSRYLSRGKPGYVERPRLSPEEAIEIILQAGGVPVLAHPGLIGNDDLIEPLVRAGLQGLEAKHSDHSEEERIHYKNMADKLGLLATGGSDFHGKGAEHRGELGSVTVQDEVVACLQEKAKQNRGWNS